MEEEQRKVEVRTAVESGLARPFEPSGPQLQMPERTYDVVRRRPEESLVVLEEALHSKNAIVRANAYDFLARLAEVKTSHDRAIELLRLGLEDEAIPVKEFTRNILTHLKAIAPTTGKTPGTG